MSEARQLYRRFHGREPAQRIAVRVPEVRDVTLPEMVVLGRVTELTYRTQPKHDDARHSGGAPIDYVHDFAEDGELPILAAHPSGAGFLTLLAPATRILQEGLARGGNPMTVELVNPRKAPPKRRSKAKAKPKRRRRRNAALLTMGRRRNPRRRRLPTPKKAISFAVPGVAGFFAARYLTRAALGSRDQGLLGIGGSVVASLLLGAVTSAFGRQWRAAGAAATMGGLIGTGVRAVSDFAGDRFPALAGRGAGPRDMKKEKHCGVCNYACRNTGSEAICGYCASMGCSRLHGGWNADDVLFALPPAQSYGYGGGYGEYYQQDMSGMGEYYNMDPR